MTAVTYKPRYTIPSIDDAIAQVATHLAGVHEACEKVPKIGQNDFDILVDAIKADGLLRPIEINEDRLIVDGRSRIQACAAAGITLNESDFVTTNEAPLAIARSNNARRHLNEDQKAMEAARLLEEERKRAEQRKAEGALKGRQANQSSLGTETEITGNHAVRHSLLDYFFYRRKFELAAEHSTFIQEPSLLSEKSDMRRLSVNIS